MMDTTNFLVELRDYAMRTRSELYYDDLGSVGPGHNQTFTQKAVLNGKAYPDGVGKNKKEAKYNAAKNAIKCLLENEHQDTVDRTAGEKEELDLCTRIRRLGVNSMLHRSKQKQSETKYTGLVAHYCQRTNRCHSYIEERRCGPPHNPRFFYKLMIDKKEYPEGEGKTAKEAKQNAARLAWCALQDQSDWDSKVSVRSTVSEDGTRAMSVESPTQESPEPSSQIAVSSIPPKVQMSVRSEDDVSTKLSASNSLESLPSSQSMSVGTSGSELFTESSNSSNNQDDVVKQKNMGNNENEICTPSRFTSDFDIMECLGSGAFGCVYKVKHKLLKKHYAVKIVRCGKNSLREVGTLSDLLHHNIIRYYTFWMEDTGHQWNISADSCSSSSKSNNSSAKYLYIQMELCDTKTLKAWIDEKNTQPLQDSKRREESLKIAQQIVGGVEYIHSQKHVHRDLKPENILFGLDGQVKIGDFGLVTSDYDNDDSALMERTGDRGTTTYMAPEQKTETYDRKVDIFALGLIYFELLWKLSTGHERVVVWGDARSQKFPEEFSLAFPQEDQIIKSMLCEKPEDRPEANTLKAELEKWKFYSHMSI